MDVNDLLVDGYGRLPDLVRSIADAAAMPICRGFAVGRSIFGAAARDWFAGTLDDDRAVATVAGNYTRLISAWRSARGAVA